MANNASLVLISLSLNQIIRSGIPIVTAILGIAIEHTVRGTASFSYYPSLGTPQQRVYSAAITSWPLTEACNVCSTLML